MMKNCVWVQESSLHDRSELFLMFINSNYPTTHQAFKYLSEMGVGSLSHLITTPFSSLLVIPCRRCIWRNQALMSTVAIHRPELSIFSYNRMRNRRKVFRVSASWTMTMDSKSSQIRKDELSLDLSIPQVPQFETSRPSSLRFDRLQPSDQEFNRSKIEFGKFVAREVILDEEYWTAAWLRAESHWEDRPTERYIDSFKRKYAEEEFNALKRRCKGQHGQKSACIVMVKKEEKNVKRTVLKSVVGTLDLSIRYLLHGETFPGERVKAPLFCSIDRRGPSRYGYVSNLCVAKSARRQGIASNMLHFAVESARIDGVEQVFVHVYRNNEPAQELYQKMGFEIVEVATSLLTEERTFLLRIKT